MQRALQHFDLQTHSIRAASTVSLAEGKPARALIIFGALVGQVWRVVTDYERLAEFIPNLARCDRVPGAPPGRIRLRQLGCSQA